MTFTDQGFALFLPVVFLIYWMTRSKRVQNLVLLIASYVFYGFIHPWFCLLIATSTLVDYFCGLMLDDLQRRATVRKLILGLSLATNLCMLGVFKYYNFFVTGTADMLDALGIHYEPLLLQIVLPAGISFYTFQTLSYTIDIYRGQLRARNSLLDFAVFVSCFPQLVAGPIERAARFLPQIETVRRWNWNRFFAAFPLLLLGFLKKMVVADNLSGFVEQIYMLRHPSAYVLFAGTLAFAIQILADFSAYTDMARGCAKLLGFDLVENFNAPYLAISPSDFWRRWHISLSTWIRDYIYIPLGGSRVSVPWRFASIVLITFALSGLWHGAEWHFVLWGIYHAVLLVAYHGLGLGGRWKPQGVLSLAVAWGTMTALTLFGWTLFRANSVEWLVEAVVHLRLGLSGDDLFTGTLVLAYCLVYSLLWWLYPVMQRFLRRRYWYNAAFHWVILAAIVLLANHDTQAFIYFQF